MYKTIHLSRKTIFFLLVFLVIYCSHDTILFGTNIDNRFITIRKIFPFFIVFSLLLIYRFFRISRLGMFLFLIILLLPIVSCLVNREAVNNYIYRAVIMVAALLMVLVEKTDTFYDDYNKILYFLSIWSLGTYVVMLVSPGIMSRFPAVTISGGTIYRFTVFATSNTSLHYGIVRNSSIFREPGMFCVMLTVAILNEVLVLKTMRMKYLGVYIAAVITTFSTAGYIIVVMFVVYYLIVEKRIQYRVLLLILTLTAALFLATQTDMLSAEGAVFSKFTEGSNSYGSWIARLRSITTSLSITIQNPICGIGRYALYDVVLGKYGGMHRSVDNTNTILIGFAAYGVLFGLVMTWGCWMYIWKHEKNPLLAVYLFSILLMALSNEDMGQNILFYYLVFDGLCIPKESTTIRRELPKEI